MILYEDKYGKIIREYDNFIEAYGGDGTLLKAINMFKGKNKPFFGVAGGTENFLMNEEKTISKNHKIKKFRMIKAEIYTKNGDSNIVEAFNDILIGGDMNSWIEFDVSDKDEILGSFKGGGIIISTAQGSTGINKNNGGVILPLSSNSWSITGDKTNRKINYVLDPKKMVIECSSRTSISLWADGSNHIFKDVFKVVLTVGRTVEVIFNNYEEFKRKRK